LHFGKEIVLHTRNYLSAKDLRQMNGCSTFFATDKGGHFFSRGTCPAKTAIAGANRKAR
jgi:hypothetical protein